MNINGMDYNTQREKLRMPEYGRSIHLMVEHCIALPDRRQRQECAETIVKIMELMFPTLRQLPDYKHRLWDQLAIISNFRLDIDYPYEVTTAEKIRQRPSQLPYPKHRIPVRHYGNLVFETLEHIKSMPEGKERDELTRLVANQMKRDLVMYGNASPDNDRIISDIAKFTDGLIQIDPKKLTFEFIVIDKKPEEKTKKKKRK